MSFLPKLTLSRHCSRCWYVCNNIEDDLNHIKSGTMFLFLSWGILRPTTAAQSECIWCCITKDIWFKVPSKILNFKVIRWLVSSYYPKTASSFAIVFIFCYSDWHLFSNTAFVQVVITFAHLCVLATKTLTPKVYSLWIGWCRCGGSYIYLLVVLKQHEVGLLSVKTSVTLKLQTLVVVFL